MAKCPICGGLTLLQGDPHDCKPKWRVWCAEEQDETMDAGRVIEALNPKDAAEEWASREDRENCDYWIVAGDTATVSVMTEYDYQFETKNPKIYKYAVNGESVPVYHAREIK